MDGLRAWRVMARVGRAWVSGLVKLVHGWGEWQSSWAVQHWKQAMAVAKLVEEATVMDGVGCGHPTSEVGVQMGVSGRARCLLGMSAGQFAWEMARETMTEGEWWMETYVDEACDNDSMAYRSWHMAMIMWGIRVHGWQGIPRGGWAVVMADW